MIRGYSDRAANERTFLAWVRPSETTHRLLMKLSGPLGRYDDIGSNPLRLGLD